MSRNGSYAKSMNGIVSFDDGDGTTIEGSEINTETINCNTLTASSIIYTDFIDANTIGYTQCLSDVVFNATVSTNTAPVNNSSLCNKLYVDTVAGGSTSILPLDNVFTGNSNTFNNLLITNNISPILSTDVIKIGSAIQVTDLGIQAQAGGATNIELFKDITSGTVTTCNNLVLSGSNYNCSGDNNIIRLTEKLTTGVLRICNNLTSGAVYIADAALTSGSVNMCGSFIFKPNSIASTGTTDIINLFNNISGTIGQINMAGKFVIKELSIASTSITDNVNLFNNLSGAFGVVKMATNLLFKQSNILSSAVGDIINLFTNLTVGTLNIGTGITGGTLNLATNITTGTLNIATGVMTGILNLGTGITTGTLNIGSDITTGDIFIGNTSGTTAGALGDITMGNGSNSNNTAGNGRVIINKLRIGNSPILRNIRYGSVAGGSQSAVVNFSPAFPSGQVPFITGSIQANVTTNIYGLTFSSVTNTSFRYMKSYITNTGSYNAAVTESFHYYAWSD